jgi:hypothetical protein
VALDLGSTAVIWRDGGGIIVIESGGVDMEYVLLPLLYILPLIVGWVVVYTAVLAALRRHDRD